MILVAGIGNIFLGDDAFGSEVARRMAQCGTAPHVRVKDFGTRALDFAYALQDGYDAVIIVDAAARGGEPGTIYVVDPAADECFWTNIALNPHTMDPATSLALARAMGATLDNVRIVGCEPESFGPEDEGRMGLSPPVAAAVDKAIQVIESLMGDLLRKEIQT